MTFLEERDLSDVPRIPEYFRGKTVFITGGSGFLGKVLIEKLLYSCSELDRIYVLLRTKKGVTPEDRKNEIYKFACFDRLRSEKPGLFESKVFIIPGDISEPNLAISMEDRALLVNKTNIIFHCAASVRFDDSLKISSKLNLLGTKQMLELARDIHDLDCFVHISTAFSNRFEKEIQEKFYPSLMNWRELLELSKIDDHTLQVLTPKLLNGMSNTYVLTKHLTEHMVYEEKGNLPIVIVRPSIVTSSLNEPTPGWNDNFNGPTGILIAAGTGISGILYVDENIKSDYIPVDLVVRSVICSAWIRGTKTLEPDDDIPIYNACAGGHFNISNSEILTHGETACEIVPFENIMFPPSKNVTTSKFIFSLYLFFNRLIVFAFLDLVLKLSSKKPRLVKIIRRIYVASYALKEFAFKEWTFKTDNFMKLRSVIKEEDVNEFKYNMENIDRFQYVYDFLVGAKKFLLNEKMENLPTARLKYYTVIYSFMAIKIFFFTFLAKMTFLEERDLSNAPLIPEYFKGKTVFITGGSGFLGKILIEKLLYSCLELNCIYVLLRSKRSVSPEKRRDEIYKFACFDRLRKDSPGLFESKVFIIPGDISEPNLVSSSLNEPVQGWIDNFNGPTGIILAALTGLSSVVYVDKQLSTDYIPVDLVVRSLISAAWIRGTKKMEQSDDIPIYNACSDSRFDVPYSELIKLAASATQKTPLENIILPASFIFTTSRFIFNVYLFFTRVILYSFFDSVLQLLSKKPRLVKLIRRFYIANLAVENFTLNEWTFNTDNFVRLSSVLREEDIKEFSYKTKIINHLEYISNLISGAKKYLLNEKIEDLPKAKAINDRVKYSYMVFKILMFSLLLWYIFSYYSTKIYD